MAGEGACFIRVGGGLCAFAAFQQPSAKAPELGYEYSSITYFYFTRIQGSLIAWVD